MKMFSTPNPQRLPLDQLPMLDRATLGIGSICSAGQRCYEGHRLVERKTTKIKPRLHEGDAGQKVPTIHNFVTFVPSLRGPSAAALNI
jgi:hypothetical protein